MHRSNSSHHYAIPSTVAISPCSIVIASSPGLPRLFVAALGVKAGRPGRFWYVRLRQVDTNVTSANEKTALVHLNDATSMPSRL